MCDSVLSHLDSLFPELNLENPTCEIFNQPATYDDGTTVPNLLHYLPILTPCCGGDPNKLFNKGTSCSKFANFCADPNDYKEHLKLTEPTGQSELTCEGWLGYTNALLQAQDVSNPRCSMFRHPATHSNGRVVPNLLSWLGFLTPCCGEDIVKIFTDNSTDNALPLLFNGAPLWTIDRVQSGDCDGAVVETNVSIGQWIAGTNNDEYIQANFAFGTNCLSILHQSFLCDTTHVTRTEKICSNAECTNFIGNPVDFIRTRDEFDAYKTGKCHVADYGFGMTGYTFSVENNPLVELKVCESSYRFENFCADPHDYKGNFLINTPEGKATSCHQLLDVYDSLSPSIDLANPTCDMFQEGPLTLGNNTVIPNLLHALPMLTPCCGGDPSKLFNKGISCSKYVNFCTNSYDYEEYMPVSMPQSKDEKTCEGWLSYLDPLLPGMNLSKPTCSMFKIPVTYPDGTVVSNSMEWLPNLAPCCGGYFKLFDVCYKNFCADPNNYKGSLVITTSDGTNTCDGYIGYFDTLSPSIDLANPTCDMFQEGPLTLGNNTVITNLLHALPMLTPCCGGDPSKLFIDNTP